MSLIVVGLNHRTAPVEPARADDRARGAARQGAPRPRRARAPARGRGAVHVQPHRDLRALHALPPRGRRCRRVPCRVLGRRRPKTSPTSSTRYYDEAAVAHLFGGRRRPRLDDRRRERDPRPGARRLAGRATREGTAPQLVGCSARRSSRASACAPRPGSAAIRFRSRRPRSRSLPSTWATSRAARVLVVGAGQMGAGLTVDVAHRGVSTDVCVANRTAERGAAQRRGSPVGSARSPIPRPSSPTRSSTPTCCRVHRRHRHILDRASDDRDGDGVPRRRPLLVVDVGCRVTSTRVSERSPA